MKVGDLFQIKDHTKISKEQLDTIFNNFCFEIVEVEEYKVVFVARERIENGSRYTLSQSSYTFEEFLKEGKFKMMPGLFDKLSELVST